MKSRMICLLTIIVTITGVVVGQKVPHPPPCGPNQTVQECSPCNVTCSDRNEVCALVCINPGQCYCKPGYLFNEQKNRCVPANKCPGRPSAPGHPQPCLANESVVDCTPCAKYCGDQDKICTLECRQDDGCYCKQGFLYDRTKKRCVRVRNCPATGPREISPCDE